MNVYKSKDITCNTIHYIYVESSNKLQRGYIYIYGGGGGGVPTISKGENKQVQVEQPFYIYKQNQQSIHTRQLVLENNDKKTRPEFE